MIRLLLPILLLAAASPCRPQTVSTDTPFLIILGTVQDGGSPHPGCTKECCRDLFLHPDPARRVVSLGIVDPVNRKNVLIEATPDITFQMKNLKSHSPFAEKEVPDAIVVTHAHIGHYAGLMYLGREALNSRLVPVWAMPRMEDFLQKNGPWDQLVKLNNIIIKPLAEGRETDLTGAVSITPIRVPHRDEYSETVGLIIEGPNKKALFIPDIDKWERWKTDIRQLIRTVDYAFIDGTFYDGDELPGRNMAEIPHPFIVESMELFNDLPASERNKIWFVHLNHTNPALREDSPQTATILKNGFHVGRMDAVFGL